MASSLRELIVRISADSSVYQREMARASRMGSDYYKTMESGARRQDVALQRNQNNLRALNSQMLEIRQTALRMTGVLAGAFAAGSLIQTADAYGQMASRIRLATEGEREYAQVQERLQQVSRVTYKSLMDNSELFVNSVGPLRELGFATEEVLDITEALSAGLVISGANAQSTTSLIDQFGKAMIAGKLQGDSFNAVIQNAPRLQQALAQGLGVTNKRLAEMATAGELTANVVMGALQRSLSGMRQELEEMPTSVEDATQVLKDSFMAYIGQANEAHGTTATLAGGIELLADNIDNVVAVAGVFAAMGLGRYMGSLAVSATAAALETYKNAQASLAYAEAQGIAELSVRRREASERALASQEAERTLQQAAQNSAVLADDAARLQRLQAQLAAEKALASQRLQEQTTAAGRVQTQARIAQLNTAELAATNQMTAAKAGLAQAQAAEASATRLATLAKVEERTANDAVAASQQRLAAATSLATRAKTAALALLPGPAGLITLAAGVAASFYLFRDSADDVASSLSDLNQPLNQVIDDFRKLSGIERELELTRLSEQIDKEKEEAVAAAQKMREEIAQALYGGGMNRTTSPELSDMFAEINRASASAAQGIDVDWQAVMRRVEETEGVTESLRRSMLDAMADIAKGHREVGELTSRFDALTPIAKEAAGAIESAGNAANYTAPSDKTLQAWQRYNDQLRDQIANLRDPSALGRANRQLDAMGPEVTDVMRGYSLWLTATKEQEEARVEANKKAADAARDAARQSQQSASRIAQAYQQQAEALQRQIALHGDNSRAAALAYDLSSGSLRELLPQQQAHIRQLSEELDVKEKLFKQAQEAQELARFEAAERARLAARAQDMEIDIIAVSRSDQAVQVMREIATVRQRYADEMRELHQRQEDESTRISEAAYEERRQLLMQLMDEEVGLVESSAARKRAAEDDWRNGTRRGLEMYMDQARNAAMQSEQAMTNALQRSEDALVQFAKSGKLSFRDLADSIINDLIRIAIRQQAVGLFAMFGGSMISAGSPGAYNASAGDFIGSVGFSGGGWTGPGGKYEPAGIVHKGEVVWSQEDVARAGGLSVVEALRKGFSGYATGGPVAMPSPNMGSVRRLSENGPTIHVDARGATDPETTRLQAQRGTEAALHRVAQDFASNGPLRRMLGV